MAKSYSVDHVVPRCPTSRARRPICPELVSRRPRSNGPRRRRGPGSCRCRDRGRRKGFERTRHRSARRGGPRSGPTTTKRRRRRLARNIRRDDWAGPPARNCSYSRGRPLSRRPTCATKRSLPLAAFSPVFADAHQIEPGAVLRRLSDKLGQRRDLRIDRFHPFDQDAMSQRDFEVLGDAIDGEAFRRPAG